MLQYFQKNVFNLDEGLAHLMLKSFAILNLIAQRNMVQIAVM